MALVAKLGHALGNLRVAVDHVAHGLDDLQNQALGRLIHRASPWPCPTMTTPSITSAVMLSPSISWRAAIKHASFRHAATSPALRRGLVYRGCLLTLPPAADSQIVRHAPSGMPDRGHVHSD